MINPARGYALVMLQDIDDSPIGSCGYQGTILKVGLNFDALPGDHILFAKPIIERTWIDSVKEFCLVKNDELLGFIERPPVILETEATGHFQEFPLDEE